MKTLIKAEEVAQFALSIVLFAKLSFIWWVYPALFLVPDLSMLGYAISNKVGAFVYNLAHHKGVAIGIGLIGLFLDNNYWLLAGIVLFGHSALDRAFGYGLKYNRGFQFTHLGEVGNQQKPGQAVSSLDV
ncbi:DUF4260 domain-containing protein [Spirosoma utsteinense]|uniref:DUF4260 domain-containing protein n=1 Tax=Spirosoma utsteinense TaxID=2585773 RepID=A0ABR6WF39_9BACT|nr:DUF4260 domain-containing protein [Spirosoma utsteinense]MBC3788688.1 hypothetical protein [Spirosoma utsteinense]MBC3794620.1 hypothetical protein [Spirosoma utsteinense]